MIVKSFISILFIATLNAACINGKPKTDDQISTEENTSLSINHNQFDALLKKYVASNGVVNYTGFKNQKAELQSYLKYLSSIKISSLSKNEQLAFWINAYNAATIDQILRNYPVSSILKIDGGKVWDQTLPYRFNNESLSLNDIEKKKLLGNDLFDARVHFALNCAAKSCPPLINRAYTATNVQDYLTLNTKAALANKNYNVVDAKNTSLSKLFDWYKADFVNAEGSVVNFVNKYSAKKISDKTQISYLEYNWDLNGK